MTIFVGAWLIGAIEFFLFRSFIRKNYPEIALQYYPKLLEESISQQFRRTSWIWRKGYERTQDARLIRRARIHRWISYTAYFIVGSFLVLALTFIIYSNAVR